MKSLSASSKAAIIIAIIAVSSVSGVYVYFQSTSKLNAQSQPSLQPAAFLVSNLTVAPSKTLVNQPVEISVNVENVGQQSGNYSADLWINGTLTQSNKLILSGGQHVLVNYTLSEPIVGDYQIWVGNLTVTLVVDPLPQATSSPTPQPTSISITSGTTIGGNGAPTGGSSGGTRTWTSCPTLFVWNGTGYTRASEVSDGPGWLGFVDHYNADGSIVFAYSNPWSYMKLNSSTLQPINNFYDMTITEQSDEIFYLDSVKLLAIDHAPNVDVYSTRGTYLYNLSSQGKIYTIGKNLSTPVSAINNGVNVLPLISKLDENYTTATRWTWNTLELNLGDLSGAKEIKLVVNAVTNWPTNEQGGNWATQFSNEPGVTPSPPPYIEVKAANGTWVKVADSRQFPIPPVDPSTFVVDLTGLFPTNDYSLRINYYQDYTFDYVGVDTTAQQTFSVQEISPSSATFNQTFATNSSSTGNFTNYGDVLPLLAKADDMYIVGRQGDGIQLRFQDSTPIPQGMVRDYFVVASAWFKGQGLPYVPFTVEPLPFQNMSSYPYPSEENYPTDAAHQAFLSKYNTREFSVQTLGQQSVDTNNQLTGVQLLDACLVISTLVVATFGVFVYRRKK